MNGIERLQEMIKGQKDKYLNKIVNYLIQQTEMNEYFLNEEKNLKEMVEYIKSNAKKQASNSVAVIEDEEVYQWAKDYFIKSNKELGIVKYKLEKGKHGDVNKIPIKDDEFGSIFEDDTKGQNKEEKDEIEQISLFAA